MRRVYAGVHLLHRLCAAESLHIRMQCPLVHASTDVGAWYPRRSAGGAARTALYIYIYI